MQKHIWRKAKISSKCQSQPIPRWGHNCCVIGEEVVFFGGYADSNYMNDVWSYNTMTMEWLQVKTTGDVPSNRSNCSMNYDEKNNQIIVFGGGGPNKQRFNTINILDWKTKEWLEISPKENQPAPWERTYHSAELFYPYLVVYGGEGVADMDDLWLFNFLTLSWTEISIDKSNPRPCARRFHSSALVGNELFIISGCHGKYRPLNDVYSMDLSPLIENNDIKKLQWKQRKFKGSAFLTRWGQSSSVYDNKIYIFGGRFSSDLNDILVIDLQKQTMKSLKTGTQLPKPRRRHCSCFIGSCMIIFGGFNGQYFNDLYYINVFELRSKLVIPESAKETNLMKYLNEKKFSDHMVKTKDHIIPIHKGIIVKCFEDAQKMDIFLKGIDGQLDTNELLGLLKVLYQGYGQISQSLRSQYEIKVCVDEQEWEIENKKQIFNQLHKSEQNMTLGKRNSFGASSAVIVLDDEQFSDFMEKRRNPKYCNVSILVNKKYQIKLNSIPLVISSQYFTHLLSPNFKDLQNNKIDLELSQNDLIIFQILLNYLALDQVIVPIDMGFRQWGHLSSMASFYCLGRLLSICEHQLCLKVNEQNYKQIMELAIELQLEVLAMWCGDFEIKQMIIKQQNYISNANGTKKQSILKIIVDLLRFDILQIKLERERQLQGNLKKKQSASTQGEKQNYQINYNQ